MKTGTGQVRTGSFSKQSYHNLEEEVVPTFRGRAHKDGSQLIDNYLHTNPGNNNKFEKPSSKTEILQSREQIDTMRRDSLGYVNISHSQLRNKLEIANDFESKIEPWSSRLASQGLSNLLENRENKTYFQQNKLSLPTANIIQPSFRTIFQSNKKNDDIDSIWKNRIGDENHDIAEGTVFAKGYEDQRLHGSRKVSTTIDKDQLRRELNFNEDPETTTTPGGTKPSDFSTDRMQGTLNSAQNRHLSTPVKAADLENYIFNFAPRSKTNTPLSHTPPLQGIELIRCSQGKAKEGIRSDVDDPLGDFDELKEYVKKLESQLQEALKGEQDLQNELAQAKAENQELLSVRLEGNTCVQFQNIRFCRKRNSENTLCSSTINQQKKSYLTRKSYSKKPK